MANVRYARPGASRLTLTEAPRPIKLLLAVLWVFVLGCGAVTGVLEWALHVRQASLAGSTPELSSEATVSLEFLLLTALMYALLTTSFTLQLFWVLRRESRG